MRSPERNAACALRKGVMDYNHPRAMLFHPSALIGSR